MAWLTEWFVLWSLSFWLLLGAELVALVVFLFDDEDVKAGKAIFSLLIVAALLQFVGGIPICQSIVAHPRLVIYCAIGYVVAGVIWMCVKWVLFVKARIRKYEQEIRDEFIREHRIKGDVIPDEYKLKLRQELGGRSGISEEAPQVSRYKDELFGWFALWPVSGIWTVINDPLTRLFESIYHQLRGALQSVSDRLWRKVLVDIGRDKE